MIRTAEGTTTAPARDTGSPAMTSTLARGAAGGALAGGVFAAITMWFTASMGQPASMPLMMISAMVQGQDALMAGTASPAVGVAVHMVLSIAFGVGFAALATRLKSNALIAVVGAIYGVALYVVNFLIVSPLLFPWFADANQPFELVIHVVFGVLVSYAVLRYSRANART